VKFTPVNRSGALLCLMLPLMGCVTTPEDTYSSEEVRLMQQSQGVIGLTDVSHESLISYVEEAINTPIVFHGLVLDQSGQPVSNHPIKATVFDQKLDPPV
tara:strand:+ start:743 stop:1042 length:300 start_codon:yes stop_codon:yes gene_type:complete